MSNSVKIEYVRKDEVIRIIKAWNLNGRVIDEDEAVEDIKAMVAEPVRSDTKSHWIDIGYDSTMPILGKRFKCSACGSWQSYGKTEYCPRCGLKMYVQ